MIRHGYSTHGDYVFGWKDDSLQRAMNGRCTGDVCTELKLQTTEEAMKCTLPKTVDEDIDGCKWKHQWNVVIGLKLMFPQG
jgi:hypothetical protein